MNTPAPSDADLIHRYREIEAYCSAEQAALDEALQGALLQMVREGRI